MRRVLLLLLVRVALYAALALVALVALVSSLLLHLEVPIARHVAATWLSDFVSNEIRGGLVVSRIEHLSPTEVVARDVMLFDGEGHKIIDAGRVTLQPDWPALFAWRVAFKSGRIEDARVHLIDTGNGLPTLFTTFDAQKKGKPGGNPLHVTVERVELWQVTLYGDLLGLNGFRADDLHAIGRLDIGRDVQARIDHAHGTMNQPFGFPGIVDSLTGMISTVPTEGVKLRARAHRATETASATVRFVVPKGKPVDSGARLTVRVRGNGLSAYSLHGLGYDWLPDLIVPLSGHVTLDGPPGELAVSAELQTSAGNADASGWISSARGVSVTLRTRGLTLADVIADYPRIKARGTLRIDAPPGDTLPTLHAEIEPLVHGVLAIPGFNADATVLATGLRIDRLEARSKSARISGHGRIAKNGSLALDIQASFPEIGDDPNLQRLVPNVRGRLDATVHVDSQQIGKAKLDFSGKVAVSNLRYDVLHADRLELRGSARGDPEHPRVALTVTGKQVSVSDYVLGDPSLSLQGGPRDYSAQGQFASAGRRTFNMRAQVHADRDAFLLDAEPIEFSVGTNSWRGALQGVRFDAKGVELGMLRLASHSQRLEAHGVLRFAGEDQLDMQLQDFDLAALHALLGGKLGLTHGRADAHLELSGDTANPVIRLQGALRDGIVLDVPDVSALYLIAYKSGRIDADGEIDLGSRGLLRVDGSCDVDGLSDPRRALEFGNYNVALNAQALDVTLLPQVKQAKISGTLSSELRFEGTLQEPEFNGSLQLDQLTFPGGDPLAFAAQGGYGGGALHMQFSVSDEHGALATAGASMQLDWGALREKPELLAQTLLRGPWQLAGETSARRLDQLPRPLSGIAPYPASISTHFDLRKAQGNTTGSVDFDVGWEELAADVCARGTRAGAHGRLTLDHGVSNVEFSMSAGKAQIGAVEMELDTPLDRWADQGHFDRPRMLSGNGHMEVEAMQAVPYLCEYGNGGMRTEFELADALTDNPVFSFSVDAKFAPPLMQQAGRTQRKARGCEDDPIRMRIYAKADREELSGSSQLWGCHGGNADLEGRIGVRWDELFVLPSPRTDGVLQALVRFDGAHLEPLLDRIPGVINASAIARGQINVSGTPAHARTSGQIEVSQGSAYLVATGQELTDITTGISFQGDWAKIDYLQARAGKGQLEAAGGIDFAGIWPRRARIALRASKLPIKREGVEIAQITGSGGLDADIESEGTRASIELHDLAVRLPETSSRALQSLELNPDVTVVTEAKVVREKSYPIDLMIRGDKRISVRRTDFSAGVSLELAVHYAAPELNIGGYIAFTSGDFEIFGKRFQINSGALRFNGEADFNPDVYLSATEKPEASGLSPVGVSVTGTLAEPDVRFSSDVCPGEMGAITYLVSGRCAADDPDLAQESTDAQSAFASGIVGGVLSLGVQNQLKDIAPRIAVGTNELGRQRVSAGFSTESLIPKFMRKLVHRVYVEGGVSGPGSEQNATVAKENTTQSTSLEFLIELYFPHNIVGSGRFAPVSWGVDVVWEP